MWTNQLEVIPTLAGLRDYPGVIHNSQGEPGIQIVVKNGVAGTPVEVFGRGL
jgi:hypothetical protein